MGDTASPHRSSSGRLRTVVRCFGETLLTVGLVAVLFVVYELFVSDMVNGWRQEALSQELHARWSEDRAAGPRAGGGSTTGAELSLGSPVAVLHVPRLGKDYRRVVLEGTAEAQLSLGPGHYPGTALPGQPGNVALAGHRVGDGSPFLDLDLLRPGDPIVLETRDAWFVYRVLGDPRTGTFTGHPSGIDGRRIVRPEDVEVIAPTPGGPPDAASTGSYLTLTTCHPRFSARQRLVVHAALDEPAVTKAGHPTGPAALQER